jgi:3-oxoacyl-[acyl-carrier-protein] synthase II
MFVRHDSFVRAGLKHPHAAPLPPGCLDDANAGCSVDRGTRLLEAVVRDALVDGTGRADLSATGVAPLRVGLFVGTSSAGLGALTRTLAGERGEESEARYFAGTRWVRRALGVEGPTEVICTVCASGAQAIEEACGWLQWGAVDLAIAAGYDPLEPFVGAGFDALGATADRAMPFRAQRSGLVLGEAGAALVLARPGSHRFRSAGRILGWASASDAFHVTSPHPEGRGVALALRTALERADLGAADVGAINAHGTSTVHNDRMESRAFARVFGPRAGGLPVYTVKGTIGHTLGAAGAVEAVVSLLSTAHRILPPTCTDGEEDPECDVDLVVEPRSCGPGVTLSISAGFGGVNCVLVLGEGGM